MSLEEANHRVRMSIEYTPAGWGWYINTLQPYGTIVGYTKFPTPNEALEELKEFLRYFTFNVLKNGDTIRKYIEKHKPKTNEIEKG